MTTSTLAAATNREYFYDYADQDPISNYDLNGEFALTDNPDEGPGSFVGISWGGSAAVEAGAAGEEAVLAVDDIGPKETFQVDGRTRIADGMNVEEETITEVKNTKRLALTRQIRDYIAWAKEMSSPSSSTFEVRVRARPNFQVLSRPQ